MKIEVGAYYRNKAVGERKKLKKIRGNCTGSYIDPTSIVYFDDNSWCYMQTFLEYWEPCDDSTDKVNHPSHYTWLKDLCGIEVIDITRHLDFNLGNSIKYILRSGHKKEEGYTDKEKTIEDLKKAIWYLNDEINMMQKEK